MAKQLGEREAQHFLTMLRCEAERTPATLERYARDIRRFLSFIKGKEPDRELVLAYREQLRRRYKQHSVNSMLAAVNGLLRHAGMGGLCVRRLRVQQ